MRVQEWGWMTALLSVLFMNSLIFKSKRGNSQLVFSISSIKAVDLQLILAGAGCLKLALLCIGWGGSGCCCCCVALHRAGSPTVWQILPLLQHPALIAPCWETEGCQPACSAQISSWCSCVPKWEEILPLSSAFDRNISSICLLPNIPVKEHWLLPVLGLGGCSIAAGLVQRKSVLDLAVQALCWHGAEANTQPCSQIHSIYKHFTADQYLVKSKLQEERMGRIKAEGHSLHPCLLIHCPTRAVTVKNCNPLL